MSFELQPGRSVVYQGVLAEVLELSGHDALLIRAGETGVIRVLRAEVIPLAKSASALDDIRVARIPDDAWERGERRAEAIRDALSASDLAMSERVENLARTLELSERHCWRLMDNYKQDGTVSGLITAPGGRPQGTRLLDPKVEQVIADKIETVYLTRERPSVHELWQRVGAECRERNLPAPAYQTVAVRVEMYRDQQSQKLRIGAKAARYAFQPMPRHVEVSAPLERVEIDHTPLDVMVRSDDPACAYVGRPWLTIAVDVYTRCILGMHIGFEPPSVLSVALCLTHSVLPKVPAAEFNVPLDWEMCGLPKEIVVDNAKEFQSEAFRRGCSQYGIHLSYRPVGAPHHGGTIERLIGTMVGRCHLLPGTTKNSVRAKGEYDSQKHAALTLRETRRWFVEQVLGSYHLRPHRMLRVPPKVAWQRAMKEPADAA